MRSFFRRVGAGQDIGNHCKFAELIIRNHVVGIVIDASKDRLDIFTARVESVFLAVANQIGYAN